MQILDLFWRLVLISLVVKMKLVYLYRFNDSMRFFFHSMEPRNHLLIDFSLTKAATLIFLYGCGLAISSAKEGKSGSIIIWRKI